MKHQLLCGTVHAGESTKAIQACNDYLNLGPGRSMVGLVQFYATHYESAKRKKSGAPDQGATKEMIINETKIDSSREELPCSVLLAPPNPLRPPTLALSTIKRWSTDYHWRARALSHDRELEEEKAAYLRAHRLHSYGAIATRLGALKKLATLLEEQIFERSVCANENSPLEGAKSREYHNLWLTEEKLIGSGDKAQWVTVTRFNGAIIAEFRACLNDIAQELGERHYSSDANQVLREVSYRLDRTKFWDAQLERMVAGEHPVIVLLEPYLIQRDGG